MKEYKYSFSVGKPYANYTTINSGTELEYMTGSYVFKYGIVSIYQEPKLAAFSFVFLGKVYNLTIHDTEQPLTKRQLTLRAGKFAKEIVSK